MARRITIRTALIAEDMAMDLDTIARDISTTMGTDTDVTALTLGMI